MRAGVLTFHAAHHYGAQLQAYALARAIAECGVEAEIIDYVRDDTRDARRLVRPVHSPMDVLANLHTLMHRSDLKRRLERFDAFVNTRMPHSARAYRTYAELASDAPVYDAYVCGSDQIWNPQIFREQDFDPAFFAAFAQRGRKIAYAPSFGLPDLPLAHHAALKSLVQGFAALSVRERNGETILADVCGRESVTVLDPTLLLGGDQWREIASPVRAEKPYLLCYFISDPAQYAADVQAVASAKGLRIVSLCGARRTVRGTRQAILDAGPEEFLGWIARASHVMTDSFHGTIFSILFDRPFHTFSFTGSGKAKVSSRLDSLLGILGLRERLLTHPGSCRSGRAPLPDVDVQAVQSVLSKEREASLTWLRNALWEQGTAGGESHGA